MSWLTRGLARVMVVAGVVMACGLGFSAGIAQASSALSWSGPVAVDPHQQPTGLSGVSCPTTIECVGIDGRGDEVTFNPQAPQGDTVAPVDTHALIAVACVSDIQCTAVDVAGEQVTFNPQAPSGATPATIDTVGIPLALACASATQCVTVDTAGQEVTFNPQAPSGGSPATIDPGAVLVGVSCPSTAGCYAVDTGGTAILFNPQTGGRLGQPQPVDTQSTPVALTCPQGNCVLVDAGGSVRTFSPSGQGQTTIDGSGSNAVALSGLSCLPDTSHSTELIDCAAVDVKGREITFEARSLSHNAPVVIDPGQTLTGVSCVTLHQCTAVDQAGQALTFDPFSPGTPTPVVVDGQTHLSALACPTTSQCTAMDLQGGEVTFTPGSGSTVGTASLDPSASAIYGVACPSTSQCTAVDDTGHGVTFNPAAPGSPTPAALDPNQALLGIACPTATQCTAVDGGGGEVTFNPQAPGSPKPVALEGGHGLPAIACPSATQCTALDDSGNELTFNPQAPGTPTPITIDSIPTVALACPTANQCTAIDSGGQQVTFFPQSRSELSPRQIDSGTQLTAIACRTPTGCVAVDQAGHALEGDPRGVGSWSVEQVSGGTLPAVACPSATECVSVDVPGDAFTGLSGPLPPVPGPLGIPSIRGKNLQGITLATSPGTWSNEPTSFIYQWERCTSAGRRCVPISGASGATYVLTAADVGHRLLTEVWAYNIAGGGPAQLSSLTATIRPEVSLGLKRASLRGLAAGRPRLSLELVAATAQPPLTDVTITLPRGLALTAHTGRLIKVLGTHKHFRFRVKLARHRLEIICLRRTSGLRITIPATLLAASHQLVRQARAHHVRPIRLGLVVGEDFGGRGTFALKVRPSS